MTLEQFKWEGPAISADDQALIEAYQRTGIPLDSLAYTDEFQHLVEEVEGDPDDYGDLRKVYRRLLSLRKRGLLPRLYAGAAIEDE